MSDKQQDIQPEVLAMDKPDLPVEQEPRKDETTTEGLEETGSTASKKVRTLRSRKKSAKTRLTKARNQLADLVDKKDIGLGNLPTKTEIRKAVFKVESEFNIIIKLIYSIKEIIALEDGEEHTEIDEILEALDNEVEELTVIVDTAVKRAKEHIQQRLELGEEKSDTASSLSKNNSNDDQSSVLSSQSSLALKRRKEAEESKERLFALEKEQQQEEEELQRRVAALQLTKQRTEEARQVVVINETRATAAENDASNEAKALSVENLESHKKQFTFEIPALPTKQCPAETEHLQRRLAPIKLKGVELPTFSGEVKADYAPWKAAFMSVVDEAAISTKEKMLRLQNSLTGKALRMVKDLGFTVNAYERAKEKLEKKYGGEVRLQISNLTTLRGWSKLRPNNLDDMEEFLALLDRVLVSLRDSGQGAETNGQNLNLTAKEKLSAKDVEAYKYWLFERSERDTFENLVNWLEMKVQIMDETKDERRDDKSDDKVERKRRDRGFGTNNKRRPRGCVVTTCKEDHPPWICPLFKKMTVLERKELISKSGRCFRCLAMGHQSRDCNNARKCGIDSCTSDRHSRYLHENNQLRPDDSSTHQTRSKNPEDSLPPITKPQDDARETTHATNKVDNVSLMVLPALITNGRKKLKVNVMLDPCSTGTYVTESASHELDLRGQVQSLTISGTGGSQVKKQSRRVELSVTSLSEEFSTKLRANVLKNITGETPAFQWSELKGKWPHLETIPFDSVSRRSQIDVLIGSDHPIVHRVLREVHGPKDDDPIARLTNLGWVCFGPAVSSRFRSDTRTHANRTYQAADASSTEQATNDALRRFWDLESLGIKDDSGQPTLTLDEQAAVDQLQETQKLKDGNYEIGIPWRKLEPRFSENYDMALSRLGSLEKSLSKKGPGVRTAYQRIIDDYIAKGYVKIVPKTNGNQWFLPHFPVVREDKSTTKVRIVFDAAAQHKGKSLNDAILPGPKLQRELFDVLIRFRRAPVALSADISEMFLQVRLREEDRPFHRFLWRSFETAREPDVYEFQRLPFGNTSSPFCAQHVLHTHVQAHATEYPKAAETVDNSMYVDDVLDSCETTQEAQVLQSELSVVLRKAGFNLRKWLSNEPSVLKDVPFEDRLASLQIQDEELPAHKTLGVLWKAKEDTFTFKVDVPETKGNPTKRSVLSAIAALFDPLQFLAPFTVRPKVLMQELWIAGIGWDDVLPSQLQVKWNQWISELPTLSQFTIPRCLRQPNPKETDLHVFSDASENAYATAAYLVSHYPSTPPTSCLIAAKSRVSPIKATTIPRLELMGAVLSTRVAKSITQVLSVATVTFWTDSTNVLFWVRNQSRSFKPFVANRVGEIQRTTDPTQWRHVPGKLNPADLPTRGVSAKDLIESKFWKEGPEFLKADESTWPEKLPTTIVDEFEYGKGKRVSKTHLTQSPNEDTTSEVSMDPTKYSSLQRLVRVTAWILRFARNCKLSKERRVLSATLASEDISEAETLWIRRTQAESFPDGEKQQSLAQLNPKIDKDGLLRLNGRLRYANELPYDVKHPILLPKDHPVTRLVIAYEHSKIGHGTGTERLLAELRTRFWIVKGRRAVRNVVEACRGCRRQFRAKPVGQMMAPLPEARLKLPLRAFERVGVDYGGPFLTKQGRRKAKAKRYLCLFTCLNTRAVHLEMAYSLDTDSFINAFIRMTARRGTPTYVVSDNGTNFVGAERELRELLEKFDQDKIINATTRPHHSIEWKFNPPSAPHFGGVFEAMIKSSKKAMRAILGDASVTDEELHTAIVGAEGQLNSRPITYVSSDANDLTPLTPNHFIVGQLGGQYAPEALDVDDACNPRKRWRRVQQLLGQFWARWRKEFLPNLNTRGKWYHPRRNMKEGDVVLLMDPKVRRGEWPLGRITEVHPGKDGLIRVVKVKVGESIYERPVHRLCPLESDD